MAYKVIKSSNESYAINLIEGSSITSIPLDRECPAYIDFLRDIALEENSIEGADNITKSYSELRVIDYPSIQEQLDMQYWDGVNGTSTWADAIEKVKADHPTSIQSVTTVEDVPSSVQEDIDWWLQRHQLEKYAEAVNRLSRYIISEGQEEVRQNIVIGQKPSLDDDGNAILDSTTGEVIYEDETKEVIITHAIPALPDSVTKSIWNEDTSSEDIVSVSNPDITLDVEERAAAQIVIDSTPQSVIDIYEA